MMEVNMKYIKLLKRRNDICDECFDKLVDFTESFLQ